MIFFYTKELVEFINSYILLHISVSYIIMVIIYWFCLKGPAWCGHVCHTAMGLDRVLRVEVKTQSGLINYRLTYSAPNIWY